MDPIGGFHPISLADDEASIENSNGSKIFRDHVSIPTEAKPISKQVVVLSRKAYPETIKKEASYHLHGVAIKDEYQWLEDGKDPEVKKWENQQGVLTQAYLKEHTKITPIFDRFLPLIMQESYTPPEVVLEGGRWFSYKREAYQDQSVCTMHYQGESKELLNPNLWGGEREIDSWVPSDDGKYMAIRVSTGGKENSIIHIFDTNTQKFLPDTCKGWKQAGVQWTNNNEGFFYSAKPLKGEVPDGDENYWRTVYYHKLGTAKDQDIKIFAPEVKEDWASASVSEDGKYLLLYRSKFGKDELFLSEVSNPKNIIPLATGFDAEYTAQVIEDQILIRTDFGAEMSQVFITSVKHPERKNWKTLIAEDPKFKIVSVVPANKKLYIVGMQNACSVIKIYNLQGNYLREIPLPTYGTADVDGYWSRPEVRIEFQSFLHPAETFSYDFENSSLTSIYQKPFDVDCSKFKIDQVWYTSKDGTKVSMFVLYRKDLKLDGNNPAILAGYGGFDISLTPAFLTPVIPWIDAGGVCALPNLRGGGEYGQKWHEDGKKEKKQNVFDDFIAAAEWLIANKFTNSNRLGAYGASNGGLLVAAAMTQRPDLFRAIFCEVPLLDMLRYEEFDFAKTWSEEYGSVKDAKQFHVLHSYSPYHHVKKGTGYPSILITAAENDTRVNPLHARKMIARLQAANPDGNPILYYLNERAGHTGAVSLMDRIKQELEPLAFLNAELAMEVPEESFWKKAQIYSSIGLKIFNRMVTEPVKGFFKSQDVPKD